MPGIDLVFEIRLCILTKEYRTINLILGSGASLYLESKFDQVMTDNSK